MMNVHDMQLLDVVNEMYNEMFDVLLFEHNLLTNEQVIKMKYHCFDPFHFENEQE